MLDEFEDVVADFILGVLLFAQHSECGEDDTLQELGKDFIALTIDQVQGLEDVIVLGKVLTKRQMLDENW